MKSQFKEKILVTGGGGYIGSIATNMLLKDGYQVVVIDNFSTGYKDPLEFLLKKFNKKQLTYYEADLTQPIDYILKKEKDIKAVLHYAGCCSVNESISNPQKYFHNNTSGSQSLLSSLTRNNIKNIVFSSTCAVYGEAQYLPVDENHPTNPTNPYGLSKRMTEQMIEWYGKSNYLKYIILRYFNVTGAGLNSTLGDSKKPSVHLIQNAIRGVLKIEPFYLTCQNVNTKDKTPIRDYIDVVDLNKAHILALKHLLNGGENHIINLGTGNGNSVLEIMEQISQITKINIPIKNSDSRKENMQK